MTGPPVEIQVRVEVEVVAFGSVVSWNWREVTSRFPGVNNHIKILFYPNCVMIVLSSYSDKRC